MIQQMTEQSYWQSVEERTETVDVVVMSKAWLCGNGCPLVGVTRRTKARTVFKAAAGKEKIISPISLFSRVCPGRECYRL